MKRKGKLGQVSIFIIVLIVIIASIFLYFLIKNSRTELESFSQLNANPELKSIKNFILSCRDNSITESIEKIGIQGGYYDKPEKYLDLNWTFIPYYYHEGEIIYPSKEKIEEELSKAVSSELTRCIEEPKFEGLIISHEAKTQTVINQDSIEFLIDMPLSIRKGVSTITINMKDAPASFGYPISKILEIAYYIADSYNENKDILCVTCVAEMAEERDLYVNSFFIDNDSELFIIQGKRDSGENYYFEFASKYKINSLK